jgi:NitT/TauT family transport system substrate-binding protein
MKKKWMVLACTFLLGVAALVGCGKKEEAKENNVAQTVEPTITTEPTSEPTTEPTTEPTVETTKDKITVKVASLKGPTAMGLVQMMDQSEQGLTANTYELTVAGTPDEITTGIIKGDYPIATIPCNLAAVLYAKSNGAIKVAGINTLSVLYVVETGDSIQSIEDLRGKTIYSTGKGTTPEYTLNYLLQANGIDPNKDVTIEYKSEATEVAALLSESEDAIALLPQPYVTTVMASNEKVRIALDLAKEWEAVSDTGSSIVTGVVVVNTAFLNEHKDVVDAFLEEYKASVAYVNEDLDGASTLIENYDIIKKQVAMKAIPLCNIVLIQGEDMKTKIKGYLQVLFDQEPKAVGGSMPDDGFYYE